MTPDAGTPSFRPSTLHDPRPGLPHALVLGLALTLFFTGLGWLRSTALQLHDDSAIMLEGAACRWLTYALLTPLVNTLASRWPLARGHTGSRAAAHFLAMAGLAFLHNVIVACVFGLFHLYPAGSTLAEAIRRLFMNFFAVNLVIFWAIDGAYHAIGYHNEVRARDRVAAELRARLSTAQLEMLRAQLNPHFLFNTLNAVSSLALAGEREQVVRTLAVLSDLLRVSLDRDLPQEVPLERELEFLNGYLEIQRVRFGVRVEFALEIALDVHDALVPSMVLQPLVENAIEHGVMVRTGPGRVVIRACREGATLHLQVRDSGPGFPPGGRSTDDAGIGLANTRARLAQLYGDSQSLECGNAPEDGAVVDVRLPLHTEPAGAPW